MYTYKQEFPFLALETVKRLCDDAGHGLVMKIGDFGMSRQIIMRHVGDEVSLERAMSANVIGTAAYSAPELLLADSPVKKNQVDAATVLKSDVSSNLRIVLSSLPKRF